MNKPFFPPIQHVLMSIIRHILVVWCMLVVCSLACPVWTWAGYQVQGSAVTKWADGVSESRSNFTISVDGPRWFLRLEQPVSNREENNQSYRLIDSMGNPISYLEIGCDGVDTYMVRLQDSTLSIKKGDRIGDLSGDYPGMATGVVTPGIKPPNDQVNPVAQIIWLAYASATFISANSKDAYSLFPDSVFLLYLGKNSSIPEKQIRVESVIGNDLSGLPEGIRFIAPGYEETTSLQNNTRIGLTQVTKDPLSGKLIIPLPAPFDEGYQLANYTVTGRVALVDGGHVPSGATFETFRASRDSAGVNSLAKAIVFNLKTESVQPWAADGKNFFPQLAPGSRMQDKRLPVPLSARGKHKVYLTKSGVFLTQKSDGFKKLVALVQESASGKTGEKTTTRVLLAALFVMVVTFFGLTGWRFRHLN